MDPLGALQPYVAQASTYAFPLLVTSVLLYYAATTAGGAWRQRQRAKKQVTEEQKRRELYVKRAQQATQQDNQSDKTEKKLEDDGNHGRSSGLRPRLPASTASSGGFGSRVVTMDDLRSRVTGPSRACSIGGGGCCG
ncbi:hypothetical protein BX661DRAFT_184974 [Kickxella alabastrina]|uniref:uncharacterized protein n=1 Tax=Kickxella alabastrina TaxID=61397 RepID=UPI00221F9721|nr:uncharacterized protein BX661DRAFT_184974 [Kickxella alabastrina]KAI7824931.1 hypothetical protein BX661DRAFT_184974 [Kickxella alabastrina]